MKTVLPKFMTFCFFFANLLIANVVLGQATIQTDLLDYPPGSTAYITGSGFTPGETVSLQVLHVGEGDDLTSPTGSHLPWEVVADGNGNISSTWIVPLDEDELGATLLLKADGLTSGLHAEWEFYDGNITISPSTVCTGGSVSMTASGGSGWTNYKFYKENGDIDILVQDNNSDTYNINSVSSSDSGSYYVIQSKEGSSQMSETDPLTVLAEIAGNTISASQIICVDTAPNSLTSGTLSGGTGSYSYRWQVSTNNEDFDNINGSSGANSTYSPPALTQTTYYRRNVTSGSCTSSSNVVTILVNSSTTWYADADGDGYGNPAVSMAACAQPSGYVVDNTDCDDNDANEHPGQTWYIDADGDAYGGSIMTQCERPVDGFLLSELSGTDDCDDSEIAINPGAQEICDGIDNDCDGFIDDEDSSIDTTTQTAYYPDSDGDGYGDSNSSSTLACIAPDGYVTDNTDCDDSDADEYPGQTWYIDADGDDYGGSSVTQCERPTDGFLLSELSGNGTDDCDDSDADEYPGQTWYIDADGDDYGGSSVTQCERPTDGFLLSELSGNGTDDCDDSDADEYPGQTWYIDADGDDYGDPTAVVQCERPTNGFLSSELSGTNDCDDSNALIAPDTPAPTGEASQSRCAGSLLSDLSVSTITDGTIVWYDGDSMKIDSDPLLVNGTTYYAAQKIGDCQSPDRLAITATVNPLPNNVTTGFTGGTICYGEDGILKYDANNTGFATPHTIYYTDGSTTWSKEITTADATSFAVQVKPTVTTTYTLTKIVDGNGCERTSDFGKSSAKITVDDKPSIADITSPDAVCSGSDLSLSTPTVTDNGSTVSSEGWELETGVGTDEFVPFGSPYTVSFADNGKKIRYSATNGCGKTTSNAVAITVKDKPSIADITSPDAVCSGSDLSLSAPSVTANGSIVSSEGWELETGVGTDVFASFASPYTVSFADNGKKIRYTTTNGCGTTTSNAVAITVNDKPSIADITSPSAVCSGSDLSLSAPTVTANGSTVSSEGWEFETGVGTDLFASFASPYTVSFADNGKKIRYTATNGCGTTTSNAVAIKVNDKPSIADITSPDAVCSGSNLSLSAPTVTANGLTVSSEGWEFETGVGTDEFVPFVSPYTVSFADNSKKIRYSATNGCGTTTSNAVAITVNDKPSIADITSPDAVCSGSNLSLSTPTVTANGLTVSIEGWELETGVGTDVFASFASPYTVSFADNGKKIKYSATNGCGTTTSNTVAITVNDKPSIADITSPDAVCSGSDLSLSAPTVTANGLTVSIEGWELETGVGTDVFASFASPYTVSFVDNGKKIRYSATNGCGTTTSNAVAITVKELPLIITNPVGESLVYGCNAPELSIKASFENIEYNSAISYQWYKAENANGDNSIAILGETNSTYQTPHNYIVGNYFYYVVISANSCPVQSNVATVSITPQIAAAVGDIYYTGPTSAWTSSSTSNTATVTLSATIKNSQPCGDIRTARVTFTIDGKAVPSATNLPVDFIDPNYPEKGGTASAIVQLNIGNAGGDIFDIGVELSGNYTDGIFNEDASITVVRSKPGGLISGDAKLCNENSVGYVKGAADKKASLNFYVEYVQKGKNIQNPKGKVTLKVKSYNKPDGSVDTQLHYYLIRSNAIAGLNITKPTATFSGKANIAEYDYIKGTTTPIEGNCQMVLDLEGDLDQLGVTIQRNGGGVWYSNNWENTKTVMTAICGGDVNVTGASAAKTTDSSKTAVTAAVESNFEPVGFDVITYPNPSSDQFSIAVSGGGTEMVTVQVYDMLGRMVLQKESSEGQTISFGEGLPMSTYIAVVTQGANSKTIKLVKQ